MKVVNLFIYPIKSCGGISLEQAKVTAKGLTDCNSPQIYDRQFMLVDKKGKFLTQREYPQLATIKLQIKDNKLYLSSHNSELPPWELIPDDSKTETKVKVWQSNTVAIDQGDEIANWFKQALNLDIDFRLVKQSDNYIRPINPRYSLSKNQPVSFADGYPFLLTNTASVQDLQQRLNLQYPEQEIRINMERFRPNIVVETDEAFIEDKWKRIIAGDSEFAVVKPCSRCIVTTTDQKTGQRNPLKEPLLTLSKYRKTWQGIMFGQNLIPVTYNNLKIGDRVQVKS